MNGLDTEAIVHSQMNNKHLPELLSIAGSLVSYVKNLEHNIKRKDKTLKQLNNAYAEALTRTFGYNIIIAQGEGRFAATYIVPSKVQDSIVFKDDELSKMYEEEEGTDDPITDDYDKTLVELDNILSATYDALDKTLEGGKLRVDLKNAKVHGMDKSFKQVILLDYNMIIRETNATAEELLGVTLHEVGHVFTYLSNLDRASAHMQVLADTVRNEYKNSGDLQHTLKVTYETITGNDGKDVKPLEQMLAIGKKIIEPDYDNSSKEAETLADNFAVSFGLGGALSNILSRISPPDKLNMIPFVSVLIIKSIFTYVLIIYRIIAVIMSIAVITIPISIFVWYITGLLLDLIWEIIPNPQLGTGRTRYEGDVYDTNYDRINRLKQNTLINLKNSDLDKNTIKRILREVDSIDDLLSKMKPRSTIIQDIKNILGNNRQYFIDTHYLAEELVSNQLIATKLRLKTL